MMKSLQFSIAQSICLLSIACVVLACLRTEALPVGFASIFAAFSVAGIGFLVGKMALGLRGSYVGIGGGMVGHMAIVTTTIIWSVALIAVLQHIIENRIGGGLVLVGLSPVLIGAWYLVSKRFVRESKVVE